MRNEIRGFQAVLGMSDAQLLLLARQVCGCARIKSINELLAVESFELLQDLKRMALVEA